MNLTTFTIFNPNHPGSRDSAQDFVDQNENIEVSCFFITQMKLAHLYDPVFMDKKNILHPSQLFILNPLLTSKFVVLDFDENW